MAISVSSPVTGATVAGLTSPTYTVSTDAGVPVTMKQWAVTALGGTQSGVLAHSVAQPFTVSFTRPANYRGLGYVDPAKGIRGSVPKNVHKVITRKGVIPLSGQSPVLLQITTEIAVPAGADMADPLSVKAAISAHIGALSQQSSGLGDTVITGLI